MRKRRERGKRRDADTNPPHGKLSAPAPPYQDNASMIACFIFCPGFLERPDGRNRPAPWNPRSGFEGEGANQGDVSRPERSGGRVTATDIENDRPRLPVSDAGGDRQPAGHHGAGERSVRVFMRSRSRLRKSPRTGASERSEVTPGTGKEKKTGGPRQSARSVCLPTARSTTGLRP
ncbi:MAG: hypothetical protein M0P74_11250 [Syntrophales bacterium]|nr:hypothetical protein [Syntrophales bacterium]